MFASEVAELSHMTTASRIQGEDFPAFLNHAHPELGSTPHHVPRTTRSISAIPAGLTRHASIRSSEPRFPLL